MVKLDCSSTTVAILLQLKYRLHGKIAILKGHKRVYPFANCTCPRCASHDHALELKNAQRDDLGMCWRMSLNQSLQQTATATKTNLDTPEFNFPEMAPEKVDTTLALQLADYETERGKTSKTKSKAEQMKGKEGILLSFLSV